MVPMSEAQWEARSLDEPENIQEAMAFIRQAIDVFRYLRNPVTQGELREAYNTIWCEIDIFNDAIRNLSASLNESEPPSNVTWLWQEFVGYVM